MEAAHNFLKIIKKPENVNLLFIHWIKFASYRFCANNLPYLNIKFERKRSSPTSYAICRVPYSERKEVDQ